MNSTEIYQTKRSLLTLLEKLTKGLSKPRKKFYSDILYGMSKAQNTRLSDIARALEENIDLQYTIKRLSRNAVVFCNREVHSFATKSTQCCHPIFSI